MITKNNKKSQYQKSIMYMYVQKSYVHEKIKG